MGKSDYNKQFTEKCSEIRNKILGEEGEFVKCYCIKRLLKLFCDIFESDAAVLGCYNIKGISKYILGYSNDDNEMPEIIEWFENRKDDIKIHEHFRKRTYYDFPADFIKSKNLLKPTDKYYFKALKIPSIFNKINDLDKYFICLINSKFIMPEMISKRDYKGKDLSALINVWAWRVLNYKHQILAKCSKIKYENISDEDRKIIVESIDDYTYLVISLLSFKEILIITNERVKSWNKLKDKKIPKSISTILNYIEKEKVCHICSSRNWPECWKGENIPKELSEILINWTIWWQNIGPMDLGPLKNNFYIDSSAFNMKMLKNGQQQLYKIDPDLNYLVKESVNSININNLLPKSLFKYFFSNAFNNINTGNIEFYSVYSNLVSDKEMTSALSCITKITHFLFVNMPIDTEIIRSIMWLISHYAHNILEIPKRIDLGAHLLQAARGEPALHSMKNYYRDHFFHALEVCFLGHFILDIYITKNKQLWEYAAEYMGTGITKKKILRLWYLSALLHDVGYCIDVQKSVVDLLDFLQNSEYLNDLTGDLKNAVKSLSMKIGDESFIGYKESDKPGEDHGIIAAHHLDRLLKKIAKDDPDLNSNDYIPAIRAIALHNSRAHRVRFYEDPIAFLLILCDSIQEWNRPRLDFATAPMKILSKLIQYDINEEEITGALKSVKIENLKFEDKKQAFFLNKNNKNLKFILEYTQDIQINAGVFNLWIDASCNFQRLELNGLPKGFNIKVEYITPKFYNPFSGDQWQFHRLREAASETHMNFLDSWFPDKKTSDGKGITNKAVTYLQDGTDDTANKERLILDLMELSKKKRITRDISIFRKHLTKWKNYNDDREFQGDYAVPDFPS